MNMKKMKKFFTLSRRAEGFTLVELIVVIAILAILGGVAVPAYGGYVKKANMQADQQLASEVAQALMLAYYADPQQALTASVVLSESGAKVAEGDAFSAAAMDAAFGSGWATTAKLKYNNWGNGAAVAKEVIAYFSEDNDILNGVFNGSTPISFSDNIPELFAMTEDVAKMIAGKGASNSGAALVTGAAGVTMGKGADEFSKEWASSAWESDFLMGETQYDGNAGKLEGADFDNALANAGVIKARNVALATYLRDECGISDETYNAIANYAWKDADGKDTAVPDDAAACFLGEGELENLGLNFSSTEEEDLVFDAILDYYNMTEQNGELVKGDPTKSQAYNDGLAYYAMMSTVNELKDSENLDTTNDETWWNDLSSAVNMYSAIASGSVDLIELGALYDSMGDLSRNTVVAMLVVQSGVPIVVISPVGANP